MPRRVEPSKRQFARGLRSESTNAEQHLWKVLRRRQLDGMRFNRQVVIGRNIVDFCCREARLIVEVDGGQHGAQTQQDRDRTVELEAAGYRVVRFWNNDVLTNIDGVTHEIKRIIASLNDGD